MKALIHPRIKQFSRMAASIEPKELKRHLEVISRTGKLILGFRQSYLSILHRRSKLIILANNCPPNLRREIEVACKMSDVPLLEVDISSKELGYIAGKPFSASVISVIEPGSSNILELIAPEEEM